MTLFLFNLVLALTWRAGLTQTVSAPSPRVPDNANANLCKYQKDTLTKENTEGHKPATARPKGSIYFSLPHLTSEKLATWNFNGPAAVTKELSGITRFSLRCAILIQTRLTQWLQDLPQLLASLERILTKFKRTSNLPLYSRRLIQNFRS